MKRLIVFGASGQVGQHVVRLALARGDHVVAVYRTAPAMVASARYTPIVTPTIVDATVLPDILRGADAVVSAIGLRRQHPANPWSRLVSPADLTSTFAKALVQVMQQPGMPQTVVAISAAGVGESATRMSPVLRWLFQASNIGVAYADLDRMEQVYRGSALRWVCVRPTTLSNRSGLPRPVRVTSRYGLLARVARVDVAQEILNRIDMMDTGTSCCESPMITGQA